MTEPTPPPPEADPEIAPAREPAPERPLEPAAEAEPVAAGEELDLPFGPLHPPLGGILHLALTVDDDRVVVCQPRIGHLHRGIEKLCEGERFADAVGHLERLDTAAAVTTSLAYAGAVERLLGLAAPPRARWLRTLLAELQRIASHLLWLASAAVDCGAVSSLPPAAEAREAILDLFEGYRGGRITVAAITPGGLAADLPPGWLERCRQVVADQRAFKRRTVGVGVLSPEAALDFGVTGPILRASGVDWDVRKVFPYEAYGEVDFEVPLGKNGDAYERAAVRLLEMREAARIAAQCLDRLPEGPLRTVPPAGASAPRGRSTYFSVEGPRGEIGFFLIADGERPLRCRVRAPSFRNLAALPEMVRGAAIGDLAVILASADIALGEVDR
jgi:NADH-quinone oxidoreductase subunit D